MNDHAQAFLLHVKAPNPPLHSNCCVLAILDEALISLPPVWLSMFPLRQEVHLHVSCEGMKHNLDLDAIRFLRLFRLYEPQVLVVGHILDAKQPAATTSTTHDENQANMMSRNNNKTTLPNT